MKHSTKYILEIVFNKEESNFSIEEFFANDLYAAFGLAHDAFPQAEEINLLEEMPNEPEFREREIDFA